MQGTNKRKHTFSLKVIFPKRKVVQPQFSYMESIRWLYPSVAEARFAMETLSITFRHVNNFFMMLFIHFLIVVIQYEYTNLIVLQKVDSCPVSGL